MHNPFEVLENRLQNVERLLSIIIDKIGTSEPKAKELSANGIAVAERITGLKRTSIYNLVHTRMIPHSKRGKRLYFDEQELKDWIRKGKRKTVEELNDEA